MPNSPVLTRSKPRREPMPNRSLNFRLWVDINRAPLMCQKCHKVVVTLTGQKVDLLPLLKEHRCVGGAE